MRAPFHIVWFALGMAALAVPACVTRPGATSTGTHTSASSGAGGSASCMPYTGTTHVSCPGDGALVCGANNEPSACCTKKLPYFCASTSECYPTADDAAQACGGGSCQACAPVDTPTGTGGNATSSSSSGNPTSSTTGAGGGGVGGGSSCSPAGTACNMAGAAQCCTLECDPMRDVCCIQVPPLQDPHAITHSTCAADTDCCQLDAMTPAVCLNGGCCRPKGALCDNEADCCSGSCMPLSGGCQ